MKSKLTLLVILLFVLACSSEKTDTPAQTENNNLTEYKATPLALLMRKMDSEIRVIRDAIINNASFPDSISFDYATIKTAEPTDPNVRTEVFNSMADIFLVNVADLKLADGENRHKYFNQTIQTCINCHSQLCPGPLVRIKKLPLPDQM